ncbi:hypothetical protein JTE90_014786 [Oedothorax gibbosus]|uniref:Uncharacterized protein n=1 Tax=Oedothorax gibbosus TaxID=931172 RepID=A0AAV6UBG6_9ARAC|nr:hypothetical protein JTE90_014786 [Oedothorax gibbosus]
MVMSNDDHNDYPSTDSDNSIYLPSKIQDNARIHSIETSPIEIEKPKESLNEKLRSWVVKYKVKNNATNSFKRASAKAERLLETSAVSSDSPDEVLPIEKKSENAKRPARYSSNEAILLSEEEESQSIISSKKYPLPKLPCSYKKLPKKIMSKSRAISHGDSHQSALYSQTFLQSPGSSKQPSQAALQSIENKASTEKNQSALCISYFLLTYTYHLSPRLG